MISMSWRRLSSFSILTAAVVPALAALSAELTPKAEWSYEKAREHWAYQPLKKTAPPAVKDAAWPRGDIDRFLLATLEANNLRPAADAAPLVLLRRVYFDLIGLPPTLDQVTAFLDDTAPGALEREVDRLLASPQFGERWGRHWLDLARYAESTGKDVNLSYPHAWRYRDYVIASFNTDKPYDQFVREQIAGDLLPAAGDTQRAEQQVATGFLALGPKSVNEQNPRQFVLDVADEQIDTLSQAILGTTISCARCHDHKFDPITQREYYALAGIFTSTQTLYGTAANIQNRHPGKLAELPSASGAPTLGRKMAPEEFKKMETRLAEERQNLRDSFQTQMQNRSPGGNGANDQRQLFERLRMINETGRLEALISLYDGTTGQEKLLAMGAADLPARRQGFGNGRPAGPARFMGMRPPEFAAVGDCALYTRGDVGKPAGRVSRGFPAALTLQTPPEIPANTSGRLQLAQWITHPSHPLTSRVYVNRVWGWLFGRGIVDSPDNIGNSGARPDHPQLLDTLCLQFMDAGWSTKNLIRKMVLSRAYQLSSAFDESAHTADPENALHWRMSPRRLDAESLRDAMLSAGGMLDLAPPKASAVARAGDTTVGGARFQGFGEAQLNADSHHRSVYLPQVRDVTPDALEAFDFPDPSLVTGQREVTSTASQALFLLNSDFARLRARELAGRLQRWQPAIPDTDADGLWRARIEVAYWLVYTRAPQDAELARAQDFFSRFSALPAPPAPGRLTRQPFPPPDVWESFCRAVMASAEFRSLN